MMENKVSDIWCYFKEHSTPNKQQCTICKAIIKVSGKSNFNLKRHFKTKHPTTVFDRCATNENTDATIEGETSAQNRGTNS